MDELAVAVTLIGSRNGRPVSRYLHLLQSSIANARSRGYTKNQIRRRIQNTTGDNLKVHAFNKVLSKMSFAPVCDSIPVYQEASITAPHAKPVTPVSSGKTGFEYLDALRQEQKNTIRVL